MYTVYIVKIVIITVFVLFYYDVGLVWFCFYFISAFSLFLHIFITCPLLLQEKHSLIMEGQAVGKWFPSQWKQVSFPLLDTFKTLFTDALSIADGHWWPWMIEAWLTADSRANEISKVSFLQCKAWTLTE